jgi:hypothetical protein
LRDLIDERRGISYGIVQRGENCKNGVPVIRISNIANNRFGGDELVYTKPEISSNGNTVRCNRTGEGKSYSEVQTDDGHRMLFYAYNDYGGDISEFNGIIDYTEDKNLIVMVFGQSEIVAYGQILATFNEDEFLAICKSFAFE